MARTLQIRTRTTVPPAADLMMGPYLRALRNARGLSQRQAAARLATHHRAAIGRMEHCLVDLERAPVAGLLHLYGLVAPDETESIAALLPAPAAPTSRKIRCCDGLPGAQDRLAVCSKAAEGVRTPAYAAAAARFRPPEPPVSVRLTPSRTWDRAYGRPFQLVLDEAVMHYPPGDHQVMADQCAHLQLLPYWARDACWDATTTSELVLGGGHRLYADEFLLTTTYTTDPRRRALLDHAQQAALSPDDTYTWLGRAREAFRSGDRPAVSRGARA